MIFSESRFSRLGVMRVEGVMAYSSSRLPSRFPVGTKFVIEGRRAESQSGDEVQVYSRYLEFPTAHFRAAGPPGAAQIRRHPKIDEVAQPPALTGPSAYSAARKPVCRAGRG